MLFYLLTAYLCIQTSSFICRSGRQNLFVYKKLPPSGETILFDIPENTIFEPHIETSTIFSLVVTTSLLSVTVYLINQD